MQFHVSETCPRCRKPVSVAVVERHPTRSDMAVHNYECADCGPVKTTIVSLRVDKSPPKLAG